MTLEVEACTRSRGAHGTASVTCIAVQTSLFDEPRPQFTAWARQACARKGHPHVRVNGAEGIVRDVHFGQRGRCKERGFADVGLADQPDAQGGPPSFFLEGRSAQKGHGDVELGEVDLTVSVDVDGRNQTPHVPWSVSYTHLTLPTILLV